MDHSFPTHRKCLSDTTNGISLVQDIQTIASISTDDHTFLTKRQEPYIEDTIVHAAVERRVGRLGLLIHDLDTACKLHDVVSSGELKRVCEKPWSLFLSGKNMDLTDEMRTQLSSVLSKLVTLRDAAQVIEKDDGSSSYSDYSDSQTNSSEEGEDDREEGEDESEEEESDE